MDDRNLRTEGSLVWGPSQGASPGHRRCVELGMRTASAAVRAGGPQGHRLRSSCHVLGCPEPHFLWESRDGPQGKEAGGEAQLCAPLGPPASQGNALQTTVPRGRRDILTALQSRLLSERDVCKPAPRSAGRLSPPVSRCPQPANFPLPCHLPSPLPRGNSGGCSAFQTSLLKG